MTAKRVSFDLMNLGLPVHTDPFELDRVCTKDSVITGIYPNVYLPDQLLRTKLTEEAKNLHSDFLVRDPSSSDDSDDYAFPETITEQVRRLAFAKRRKRHYTEFATVELARRLVCAEFASATSSLKSEDIDIPSPEIEEECPPCYTQSSESYPFFQYEPQKGNSNESEESALKEDLEPGFDPSHPCYQKLVANSAAKAQLSDATLNRAHGPMMTVAEVNTDLQESLEKQSRVVDKKWDLQQSHPHPLLPELLKKSELVLKPVPGSTSKGKRVQNSDRSDKSGKPVGSRSV